MATKKSNKRARPLGKKALKKTKGGLGDGSVRFVSDTLSAPPTTEAIDQQLQYQKLKW